MIPCGCKKASSEAKESSVRAHRVAPEILLATKRKRAWVQKVPKREVKIGAPEKEPNRVLAEARAQSSTWKDTPQQTSKLGSPPKIQKGSQRRILRLKKS